MHLTMPFDLNDVNIWNREHLKVIMISVTIYKHDNKAKEMVTQVSTSEHLFYLSMTRQTTWREHNGKCEMPQLIKTKINFYYVYQTVLLPMHVVILHDILECPK